jgi:hypothetical protein
MSSFPLAPSRLPPLKLCRILRHFLSLDAIRGQLVSEWGLVVHGLVSAEPTVKQRPQPVHTLIVTVLFVSAHCEAGMVPLKRDASDRVITTVLIMDPEQHVTDVPS